MNEITVVIPNWNGNDVIRPCLDSLRTQSMKSFETIVIDNGSTDGSRELVETQYPEVRLKAFTDNTGFSRAVNEGIRMSVTPYVILLNNDTVCGKHFVEELYHCIRRHPQAFSCSARMEQMRNPGILDGAGDYYCALGWAFADGKGQPVRSRRKEHRVFSACAGAAIYRRNLLEELGLFNEQHFAYLEDVDLGYRAQIRGYENWYAPRAAVLHAGSAVSGSAHNAFKVSLSSRNSVYLIGGNMPLWQILLNLPLLAAGFLVKYLFFCRKGLGKIYRKGIRDGAAMAVRDRKRGHRPPENGAYLKIQLQLWKNLFRLMRRFSAGGV